MRASLELLALMRQAFFEEAEERLTTLESLLLDLERGNSDEQLIHTIFREVHSLKGGAGACQFDKLASFTHVFENLLAQMRVGALAPRPDINGLLLESLDGLKAGIAHVRGQPAALDEGDIACIAQRLLDVLVQAGLASRKPSKVTPDEAVLELMFWDEEPILAELPSTELSPTVAKPPSVAPMPVTAPSVAPTHAAPSLAPCASSAEATPQNDAAEARAQDSEDASVDHDELARLIALTVELSIASAALSHALRDPENLQHEQIRELFTQSQVHADEIQNTLAGARASTSTALMDVVLVSAGGQTFFVPMESVDQYVSLTASDLRMVPELGEVLVREGRTLHPLRLARAFGLPSSEEGELVAITLGPKLGPYALVVDAIVTQTRVVLRALDKGFCAAGGLLGAAIYGGQVVLVLDPVTLFGKCVRARKKAHASPHSLNKAARQARHSFSDTVATPYITPARASGRVR